MNYKGTICQNGEGMGGGVVVWSTMTENNKDEKTNEEDYIINFIQQCTIPVN